MGARALQRSDVGVIGIGKRADFLVLDAPSHAHIPYRPGVDLIAEVFKAGKLVLDKGM